MSLDDWLDARREAREERGLERDLRPRAPSPDVVDLAGNDYLGLSRDPRVVEAAADAARQWGAGAGASRLVTGTLELHAELESALAAFTGHPAALVFSTGYHANLGRRRRPHRPRHADRQRRPRARLPGRCLSAGQARCAGDLGPQRPHRSRAGPARPQPSRAPSCSSSPSTPCSATPHRSPSWPRSPRRTTPCSSSTRRTRSASPARTVRDWSRATASQVAPTWSMTMTLSKSLGSQGGAVLGSTRLIAPSGQHRSPLHLRHRTRARRGRCGSRSRRHRAPRTRPAAPRAVGSPSTRGRRTPTRPGRRGAVRADAGAARGTGRAATSARPRTPRRLLPPSVGAGRAQPAAHHSPGRPRPTADLDLACRLLAEVARPGDALRRRDGHGHRGRQDGRPQRPWPARRRPVGRGSSVVKPYQTGVTGDEPSDVATVTALSGCTDVHELVRLDDALAPESAARLRGVDIPSVEELAGRRRRTRRRPRPHAGRGCRRCGRAAGHWPAARSPTLAAALRRRRARGRGAWW